MPNERDDLVSRVAELYASWLSTPTTPDCTALAAHRKAEWQAARQALRTRDAEAEIRHDFLHDPETVGDE